MVCLAELALQGHAYSIYFRPFRAPRYQRLVQAVISISHENPSP